MIGQLVPSTDMKKVIRELKSINRLSTLIKDSSKSATLLINCRDHFRIVLWSGHPTIRKCTSSAEYTFVTSKPRMRCFGMAPDDRFVWSKRFQTSAITRLGAPRKARHLVFARLVHAWPCGQSSISLTRSETASFVIRCWRRTVAFLPHHQKEGAFGRGDDGHIRLHIPDRCRDAVATKARPSCYQICRHPALWCILAHDLHTISGSTGTQHSHDFSPTVPSLNSKKSLPSKFEEKRTVSSWVIQDDKYSSLGCFDCGYPDSSGAAVCEEWRSLLLQHCQWTNHKKRTSKKCPFNPRSVG